MSFSQQAIGKCSTFDLDICLAALDATLHTDSQITAVKCMHCQNLHFDTTPTTITGKHVLKCSVYGKSWSTSQVVNGNPLALLGVKIVQQQLYVSNLPDAKTTTTVEKSCYDEICDKFPNVFLEPAMLPNCPIEHKIQLKDPTQMIPQLCLY